MFIPLQRPENDQIRLLRLPCRGGVFQSEGFIQQLHRFVLKFHQISSGFETSQLQQLFKNIQKPNFNADFSAKMHLASPSTETCFMYLCVCVKHLNRCKTSTSPFCLLSGLKLKFELSKPFRQGVVAGSRVYHQRRHSGFPADTWPDQPCVPAIFQCSVNGIRLSLEPARRFH